VTVNDSDWKRNYAAARSTLIASNAMTSLSGVGAQAVHWLDEAQHRPDVVSE
jgi:hypothetical protein